MRWFLRLAAALVVIVVVAAVSVAIALRSSLPSVDGEFAVSGITSAAVIERDAEGIPTITASNRKDLAFATGYAHAQDRYFQMDLIRRRAAGELSALIGPATLGSDRAYRFHRFRARALKVLAGLPAAQREILDAYTAGANEGLESLDARPFEYLLLRAEPAPWRTEDTVLVLYAMFMTLNDSLASRDIRRSYAREVFPDSVYFWLYPDGTDLDAPIIGEPREPLPVPGPDDLDLRHVVIDTGSRGDVVEPPIPGSNNWAVAGRLTTTGAALVANDMHLGISVPNIYYQARLVSTGADARDVMGVTLPGSPFVVAGSNPHLAWGYTNSYGDWADAVLLVPGDTPDTYRTPAGDRAFDVHVETIEVRDAPPVELRVRETVWGPVLEDGHPAGDVAVSWIAHHAEAVNTNIFGLETVRSVAEALDVANTMGIPPQNFVTGDVDGNIAWTIAGQIPVKRGFDPRLPADWSEAAGWDGWLDPADYPRVVNPESGRIWTANTRVVDGAFLDIIGDGGYDRGARGRQIRDRLFAREEFSPEDMLDIQTDHRALFLARWQRLLVRVLEEQDLDADPEIARFLELTRGWLPYAAPDSVGYRLVRSFRLEVQSRAWQALMAPIKAAYGDSVDTWRSPQFEAALWQLVTEQPPHLLPANFESWDAFLVDAARGAAEYFDAQYDTELGERRWGERNTARIQHPLSLAVPALSDWLDMPAEPLAGDADLPRAQGPTFGASERFAVSPGHREAGIMHMPVGQSGHPWSPFYSAGHADWVAGRPSPFLPGAAAHTLRLVPAGQGGAR